MYPCKDNEASRIKANEASVNKHKLKQEKKREEERKKNDEEREEGVYRPGRHMPQKVLQISGMRSGWRCKVCRCMSSAKAKLDDNKRNGSVANKWEALAAVAAAKAEKDTDGHTRVYSGEVVWCSTCGAYADTKAHGMQTIVKGAPVREEADDKTSTEVCGDSCGN